MSVQSIIQLLGGVGLFLFAIKLISEALQLIAGDRLRQLIGTLTKTPIMGVLVGACVTVLIQSSSATTVMTVSFVDAGLMTLTQAIGVIMGANIGTTITGQILAIKVQDYAYLFIIIGVLLSFFGRSKVQKYAGNGLLGFGLLFVGMQTMESSMSFLRNEKELFLMFSHNPLMGVLAGTLLTLLVQSSAATVGLTIALGVQGLLPLHAAIPIILGDNIGTTITAVLASIGTDRTAKQACAAHVLFNVIGVCIFLTILPFYQELIAMTATGIAHQIANAHTLFNVFNTIIFLPFVKPFAALIRRLLPDKAHKVVEGAQYLDPKLIEATPGIAVEAVKNECAYMGFLVIHLLDSVQEVFFNDKKDLIPKIEETEAKIDQLHKAVKAYAEDIMQAGISDDAARVLTLYVASSGNIERIGDYAINVVERSGEMFDKEITFSESARRELSLVDNAIKEIMDITLAAFQADDTVLAEQVEPLEETIDLMIDTLRERHILRLKNGVCAIESGIIFLEILTNLERISDHCSNIAARIVGKESEDDHFDAHEFRRNMHDGYVPNFNEMLAQYKLKYYTPLLESQETA